MMMRMSFVFGSSSWSLCESEDLRGRKESLLARFRVASPSSLAPSPSKPQPGSAVISISNTANEKKDYHEAEKEEHRKRRANESSRESVQMRRDVVDRNRERQARRSGWRN